MTTNIASTKEQSARLLQCGVNPETADMSRQCGSCPTTILQYDLKGNFIAEHKGIRAAERMTGFTHSVIGKCCKERTAKVANYIFIYKDKIDTLSVRLSKIPTHDCDDLENEEWRDVLGFEGQYQVSNFGRVKSLRRVAYAGSGVKILPEKLLPTRKSGRRFDRLYVSLSKEGKGKKFLVHRLVAIAFIPNPNNLPQINHKDENPQNNHVENLEWCTAAYNLSYNNLRQRNAYKRISNGRYSVVQLDNNGNYITEYPSAIEAARQMGCAHGSISRVLRGYRKRAAGYYWMRKSEWLTANNYKLNQL